MRCRKAEQRRWHAPVRGFGNTIHGSGVFLQLPHGAPVPLLLLGPDTEIGTVTGRAPGATQIVLITARPMPAPAPKLDIHRRRGRCQRRTELLYESRRNARLQEGTPPLASPLPHPLRALRTRHHLIRQHPHIPERIKHLAQWRAHVALARLARRPAVRRAAAFARPRGLRRRCCAIGAQRPRRRSPRASANSRAAAHASSQVTGKHERVPAGRPVH
jgi:hypothetical protein